MTQVGWPARIDDGPLVLRPFARGDAARWVQVRLDNESHLGPWEPTGIESWQARHTRARFRALRRFLAREANEGLSLPFAIEYEGVLVGQVSITRIVRGVHRFGEAGYWLDRAYTGRGIMTRSLALTVDHAIRSAYLHRVEVHIRPENEASLAVVRRLSLRQECFHPRFLHIDGAWRDHVGFAVTAEEIGSGLADRTPPVRTQP